MRQKVWIPCASLVLLCSAWIVPPASASSACEFRLGFKTLHDLLPAQVGECLQDESYNGIGDSVQLTTGGLLVWRRLDDWTAFTDGYRTWLNGPQGLESRLNTERFPWEAAEAQVAHNSSSSTSVSTSTSCSVVARSGSVSAQGLSSSTTITNQDGSTTVVVSSSGGSGQPVVSSTSGPNGSTTTVIVNQSSESSSPGVSTAGC